MPRVGWVDTTLEVGRSQLKENFLCQDKQLGFLLDGLHGTVERFLAEEKRFKFQVTFWAVRRTHFRGVSFRKGKLVQKWLQLSK